jgi:hypothetical protein
MAMRDARTARCLPGGGIGLGVGAPACSLCYDALAIALDLDLKDHSLCGTLMIGGTELRRLIRAAETLVAAADDVT